MQRENIMIVDVKAAFDRYLTHSLTHTLLTGKVRIFLLTRVTIRHHTSAASRVQNTPTGRARAMEKRTAAHNNNLHPPPHEQQASKQHGILKKEKIVGASTIS